VPADVYERLQQVSSTTGQRTNEPGLKAELKDIGDALK
jgi:hypothetical protein